MFALTVVEILCEPPPVLPSLHPVACDAPFRAALTVVEIVCEPPPVLPSLHPVACDAPFRAALTVVEIVCEPRPVLPSLHPVACDAPFRAALTVVEIVCEPPPVLPSLHPVACDAPFRAALTVVEIVCEPPPVLPSLHPVACDAPFHFGSVCHYQCDRGYRPADDVITVECVMQFVSSGNEPLVWQNLPPEPCTRKLNHPHNLPPQACTRKLNHPHNLPPQPCSRKLNHPHNLPPEPCTRKLNHPHNLPPEPSIRKLNHPHNLPPQPCTRKLNRPHNLPPEPCTRKLNHPHNLPPEPCTRKLNRPDNLPPQPSIRDLNHLPGASLPPPGVVWISGKVMGGFSRSFSGFSISEGPANCTLVAIVHCTYWLIVAPVCTWLLTFVSMCVASWGVSTAPCCPATRPAGWLCPALPSRLTLCGRVWRGVWGVTRRPASAPVCLEQHRRRRRACNVDQHPASLHASVQHLTNNTSPTTPHQQPLTNNTSPTTPHQQHLTNNTSPTIPHQQHLTNNTSPTTPRQQHPAVWWADWFVCCVPESPCPTPPPQVYGRLEGCAAPFVYGSVCQFVCDDGYQLPPHGVASLQCIVKKTVADDTHILDWDHSLTPCTGTTDH